MLATATSLPELGTGISSIALLDEPDLAAGDAFGSNLFNLLIIGLLDFFWRDGPLLNRVSITSVVVAALGILAIGFAGAGVFIHHEVDFASEWILSPLSIVIVAVFAISMFMVYRIERGTDGGDGEDEPKQTLRRAATEYGMAAVTVVAAAIWLANVGDDLAAELGFERSFVGTQFLALSTSLPELAASIAAIRIGAPELAISNVLGSNLFNMGFVLFLDDVAYTNGPLWADVSTGARLHRAGRHADDGGRDPRARDPGARAARPLLHLRGVDARRSLRGHERARLRTRLRRDPPAQTDSDVIWADRDGMRLSQGARIPRGRGL